MLKRTLILIIIPSILLLSCTHKIDRVKKLARNTVMITNTQMNSGGSGVILKSSPSFSTILTNAHVCGVVEKGGFVIDDNNNKHLVFNYKPSKTHDLCLISVASDLKINTDVASSEPSIYDEAVVAGHPKLNPTIVVHGHFSKRMAIPVVIGKRPCTEGDATDLGSTLSCMFLGGVPIVKIFDSVVVTTLIAPGSSGSAVYTADDKVGALIFAGAGDLSYGYAVPQNYINYFLTIESLELDFITPSNADNI